MTYTTALVTGTFLSMGTGKLNKYPQGVVLRDGKEVWRSNAYMTEGPAKRAATKARKGFEHYFAQHGRCWKDDQDAARALKKAKEAKDQAARKQVRVVAPELLAAAESLLSCMKQEGDLWLVKGGRNRDYNARFAHLAEVAAKSRCVPQ